MVLLYIFLTEQNFLGPWKLTWSMGIEWKFYLIWPLIVSLFTLRLNQMLVLTLATLLVLVYFWHSPIVKAVHYIVLLLGATCAILLHHNRTFNFLRFLMTPFASFIMAACVVSMQLYGVHNIPDSAGAYGGAQGILIYGIVVAFFMPTLIGSGLLNRMLRSPLMIFIGQRSYALYLVQILAWQALVGMIPSMRVSAIVAVLTLVVGCIFADILYRWVELRTISFGKRLISNNNKRDIDVLNNNRTS